MVSLRVLFFLFISVSSYSQKLIQLQLNGLAGTNFWRTTGNSSTNPSTNFLGTTDAADLVIKTNNTEAMRIDASGNVGIGATSPAPKFYVLADFGSFSVGNFLVNDGSCVLGNSISSTGKTSTIATTNDGATALAKMEYNNTVSFNGFMVFYDSTSTLERTVDSLYADEIVFVSKGVEAMRIDTNGNVGIGTTSTAKLHVNGTTRLEGTPQSTTSDSLLTIDNDGNVAWRTPYYYGTGTLINGVDTVFTSDVTANSIILVTSNGLNATTQTGHLDVPTISDGNYFVVNSLKLNTTIEADDQRSYYWFFIRKP